MTEKKIGVAVKGFVFKDNKLLIIYKTKEEAMIDPNLRIDQPGGRLEFGENPYEALTREISEEVNLKVRIIMPFEVWNYIKGDFELVGINFLCEWIDGDVQLSEEHERYEWITENKVENSSYPNKTVYMKAFDLYMKFRES